MSDVLLDSNVLLRLLAPTDPKHVVAADAVANAIRAGHRLLIAPQVVMETWVVLTRPAEVNGYGWTPEASKEALDSAMQRFPLAAETPDVFTAWWRIVPDGVRGKRAHDARLAALMHVHGIRHVLTFNLDDFKNLPDIVAIEPGVPIPE